MHGLVGVDVGQGDIVLKGCRHPCLELQDNVSFIANDVSLVRDEGNFQIITGPNMGGKSTYMRQVHSIVVTSGLGTLQACVCVGWRCSSDGSDRLLRSV